MWLGLLVPYAVLTAWAVVDLKRRGLLAERLRPKSGDPSLGILLGLFMVAGGMLALRFLVPPGSTERAWLFTLYLQVGDLQNSVPKLLVAGMLICAEELVWRGLVLEAVRERWGLRAAAPVSTLLYAAAHLPSLVLLADQRAGANPLLVLAALGAGACWAFVTLLRGRLWPAILAHWVFTYFMAAPLPGWL
jgi:membrane protease YdiL (CAAX protease family)